MATSKRSKSCFAEHEDALDIVFNHLVKTMPEEDRMEFYQIIRRGIGGDWTINDYAWPSLKRVLAPYLFTIKLTKDPNEWFKGLRCLQIYIKLGMDTNYLVERCEDFTLTQMIDRYLILKSVLGDQLSSERTWITW